MNKHKYKALFIGIIAICSSLTIWTSVINSINLPFIPNEFVNQFDAKLRSIFEAEKESEQVSVREVIIEDLGVHFKKSRDEIKVTASVLFDEKKIIAEDPAEQAFLPAVENEHLHQAAEDELTQWDLKKTWSISVPSLGIRAPVLLPSMKNWSARAWDVLEKQMQVGLNHGTVAYPHSAGPGQDGNLIIAGHSSPPNEEAAKSNFGDVFAALPDVSIGEHINVGSAKYTVSEKFVVTPEQTDILEQQFDESILKLITCYPVGTTKNRMIILAKKAN